jgi:alkaline phosphatase D
MRADAAFDASGRRHTLTRRGFLGRTAALLSGGALLARVRSAAAGDESPVPDFAAATILGGALVASVRATAPARIKLRAWPTANPASVVESPWVATNEAHAAEIALKEAGAPGIRWSWQGLVQDPLGLTEPIADEVRTFPPRPGRGSRSSFTFAFGCCLNGSVPAHTLGVARAENPVFFAMIGDMGYPDRSPTGQDYPGYVTRFRNFLTRADVAPLLATAPFYGMQDDHDYGADDCWADTVKEYAGRAYADLLPGVHWPKHNYRKWAVGQADFFLLDNRRYKDNLDGPFENGGYMSVMRSVQKRWLFDGLANSDARVKFVFSPMTMSWYWSRSERREVRDFINENVSGVVVFLTGDRHAGGFFRFPNRIWELCASPLKNTGKAPSPSVEGLIWTENGAGPALSNCVGVVDVDTATAQRVTLRLMREDGVEMHREVIPLS